MKKPQRHNKCSFCCVIIRYDKKGRINPRIYLCGNGRIKKKKINPEQKTYCQYNDSRGGYLP